MFPVILLQYFPLNVLSLLNWWFDVFPPMCSRTRIMKMVSLTNYPPPWSEYRNREMKRIASTLIIHFAPCSKAHVSEQCLAQGFLKTFPLLLHPWHLLTNNSSSSVIVLRHLRSVGCGQFCGCACLRLSRIYKVGSYPSLANQPLTGQAASAVLQVSDMCRAGGGKRVPAF